jgi:hypothetical protein
LLTRLDSTLSVTKCRSCLFQAPGKPVFGVAAAKALEAGQIDAFWANAMATEIAIRGGVGKVC